MILELVSGSIDHKVPDETISPLIEATSIRGPYFDKAASKNVTALVGHTAYLNCRVRNLGNRTVSHIQLLFYHIFYFHGIMYLKINHSTCNIFFLII